jgi:D-beta-D-heptose 7-phosphate kinase/D-beta-D-heptose 1-phosphate adenosyltransferase
MNIWTNGCFDVLHLGHLELLIYSKNYNPELLLFPAPVHPHNTLYVGIDSDERVKLSKGNDRPINNEFSRLTMLKALKVVDDVFIFNSDNELRELVKLLNIDYMIVGDQYKDKEVIGRECSKYGVVFAAYGVIFDKDKERSTTGIAKKINKL